MIWHAVHTSPRKEWLAHSLLQRQGYEVLYLHYSDTVKHARRTWTVLKPYFPRYLFAGLANGQTVYRINKTPGVSTVVYSGDEPLAVPGNVIEELRARGNSSGLVAFTPSERGDHQRRYKKGERVRIDAGPLEGFVACVVLDRGPSIRVWVDDVLGGVEATFGREALSPARRRLPSVTGLPGRGERLDGFVDDES